MSDLFRVYLDPTEIGADGYPYAWHSHPKIVQLTDAEMEDFQGISALSRVAPIKDLIRERDGHRCLRCKHPYTKGDGEWSRCDEQCTHGGPIAMIEERLAYSGVPFVHVDDPKMTPPQALARITPRIEGTDLAPALVVARWRILTVHHLNGVKHDCRWWNLVSLCQPVPPSDSGEGAHADALLAGAFGVVQAVRGGLLRVGVPRSRALVARNARQAR